MGPAGLRGFPSQSLQDKPVKADAQTSGLAFQLCQLLAVQAADAEGWHECFRYEGIFRDGSQGGRDRENAQPLALALLPAGV